MLNPESTPRPIPSQGRTRPGRAALSADQVREVLAFNEKTLAHTSEAQVERYSEPPTDPLIVINEAVKTAKLDLRNARLRDFAGLVLSAPAVHGVASGLRILSMPIDPTVEVGTYVVIGGASLVDAYWYPRKRKKSLQEEKSEASEVLKLVGTPEEAIKETFPTKRLISDAWEEWFVAKGARATKLYLASRGRLEEYEEGKWLSGIPHPEWLNPTAVELTEVHNAIAKDRKELDDFVVAMMQKDSITIECGTEMLAETNRVFLFPNPQNVREYKTRPLIDVVRGLAGTKKEIEDVGIKNGIAFWAGEKLGLDYQGIYSPEGRQKIADFFGKPTRFWMGGEVITTEIDKYGIKERDVFMDGGLEMFLQLGFNRNPMLEYEDAIPTKARLEKIGLVTS